MAAILLILFVLISGVWLVIAVQGRKENALLVLSLIWWLGALGAAYFVGAAWLERGYSENWAMIGFIFVALPYGLVVAAMAGTALWSTRKWDGRRSRTVRRSIAGLILFLLMQMTVGFLSG